MTRTDATTRRPLRATCEIVRPTITRVALTLERRSGEWFGRCPFHQEHTASLLVNPVSGRFLCYGCGMEGHIERFDQCLE